ncbi:MAG: FliI/YscN family ATPase [Pseudomonadota bacterium]
MALLHPDTLAAQLFNSRPVRRVGRVAAVERGLLQVTGLSEVAELGQLVSLPDLDGLSGEVVALAPERLNVLIDGGAEGIGLGARVRHEGPARLAPSDDWIGRVVDPSGRPIDGKGPMLMGRDPRPLIGPAPEAAARRGLGPRLSTGLSLFDTVLPLARGQRMGLFAGAGVGKSTLLARLATGLEADLVVVALIGERGRELREFCERVLGPKGMSRAIVVAATADRSPLVRRRCAYAAMAVAEHFRDAGRHVLLLADSITRFAEAHREIALVSGEPAALGGYPASVAQRLLSLAERAGPGGDGVADITAVLTVLVAGGDMDGTVPDVLRGVLDGHVILDRAIAERGRYPAVDIPRSVSRALPAAASQDENALIADLRAVLGSYEQVELMVQAGLYQAGGDPAADRAVALWPKIEAFASRTAHQGVGESFSALAALLAGADTEGASG